MACQVKNKFSLTLCPLRSVTFHSISCAAFEHKKEHIQDVGYTLCKQNIECCFELNSTMYSIHVQLMFQLGSQGTAQNVNDQNN